MSDPTRPTSEIQVWPGHSPVPTWETPMVLVGRRGVNLVAGKDQLEMEELSRASNVISRQGGPLAVRKGQTALATTAAGEVESIARLNDPNSSAFTRLAGVGGGVYRGVSGAMGSVDAGYSTDPLTFCPINMPLSGEPYLAIGDRSRNRKISRTGAIELFGIPPAVLSSVVVGSADYKDLCQFDVPDGTPAAAWTATAGQDRSATPNATGVPVLTDVPLPTGGNAVQMVTDPTGAAAGMGYDSIISIALPGSGLDLTVFNAGNVVEDADLIHLLFNVSEPVYLEEVKVYFVTSAFTPGEIPGASASNINAWYKAIRQNDFTSFHERMESSVDASTTLRQNQLLQQFKQASNVTNPRPDQVNQAGITELGRQVQPQMQPGRNVWYQSGIMDPPIRRGDFARVGNDLTTGWDTVTGIVIVVQTNTDVPLTVQFADWFATGGFGPDTSDPASAAYDYRVINIHPANGSKGNPSAVQVEADKVNPHRAQVAITPAASGISELRQRAFRRGGSAPTTLDWYFVGENTSDGGVITDVLNDTEILLEETLEIDNDMPVTSVDATGVTVLNQVLPVFFTAENYCFGLGDPLQPGRLYRSKPGFPEAWPATEYQDVCAASEQLLNGGAYGTQAFVFSRTRMYAVLVGGDGSWTTEPTACAEGLVGRWAMAVTPFGVAFVSPFGIRITTGGAPDRLSDAALDPLFRGETVNGFLPVDLTAATALKLMFHQNELWLTYRDTGGTRRHWVWNFFDKAWWPFVFGDPAATVYSEPVEGAAASLLLGSATTGALYTHSGFADAGAGIAFSLRPGAWAFGTPRNEKLYAEVVIDADLQTTASLTIQPYFNDELTPGSPVSTAGVAGARRYIYEPFGTVPQRARNVAIDISGTAPTDATPWFHRLGVTHQQQPEITLNEPTPWEELVGGEGYVWGVNITCDTGGADRTILVEYTTLNGSVTQAASLTVNADGRKKLPFSFPSVLAQQIRLRPTGDCEPWIRYKVEWLSDPEPVRIPGWDTNWETFGTYADKWIKGYLIEADTFGVDKTLVLDVVDADGNQLLAQNTLVLNRPGRGIYQHSFPKIRGRLFRLRATDTSHGKLFKWQPIFDEEPLGLTRWETQERPHQGMAGKWQKPLEGLITYRADAAVTLTITSQGFGAVVMDTSTYTLPTTGGEKQKLRVPFQAAKGVLFTYLFTSSLPLWVYREESDLLVEDWSSGQAIPVPMLPTNDDLDPARTMGNAAVAAATPGGA